MDTLFFTGYAKLPAGITASQVSEVVGIGLEVEPNGRILKADCTLATELGRDFFSRMVVGCRLAEDLETMSLRISRHYHGNAQKALIAALKTAREKYTAHVLGYCGKVPPSE